MLGPKDVSIAHLWRLNSEFAKDIAPEMLVLDAGAGEAQYRTIFQHARYETADFMAVEKAYAPPTYVCDLTAIPVEDGRFDRVVFNQVLEHVPEPARVIAELSRVTKPGGRILCSCPFFFEEHEKPYDFYRYTQFGLKHLFEKAGWEVERIEWVEGYFGTMSYHMRRISRNFKILDARLWTHPLGLLAMPFLILFKLQTPLLRRLFNMLEMRIPLRERGHPINYVLWARKPINPR
jgi:SAM-dependent methyltransferase